MAAAYEPVPLLDFIPALSPRLARPTPLAPIAEAFERAERERVFIFGTTPPQHGKTELLKHGIVRTLVGDPRKRIGYGAYGASRAYKISREIRKLYQRAGGRLEDSKKVSDWRTGADDGGLWVSGVGGSWTGEGFDLIVLDDPIKGRKEAESAAYRERLWEWYQSDLQTRIAPSGSIIVIHTRWNIDDLGGRLLAGRSVYPFEPIHLPAIDAHGRALWAERRSLEELRRIEAKIGAYDWQSLYMGRPFARGGRVFAEPRYYDVRPAQLRKAVGVDMAFSKKTSSDWSVIVVVGVDDQTNRIYVLDVIRLQVRAPSFGRRLQAVLKEHGVLDARFYYAGAELGVVDLLEELQELPIEALPASVDKFVRSQPVAAAWNDEIELPDGTKERGEGRIFVPRRAPWLLDFLAELTAFTGSGEDLHDDQVDAFAAAFDASEQPGWVTAMNRLRARGGVL